MSSISFITKTLKFSFVTIISFVISFIAIPISTRIYSPDQLGHINLFNTTSSLCLYFVLFGVDQSFFRFYHEPPQNISLKSFFTYCLKITALIYLIFILLSFFLRQYLILIISDENQLLVYFLLCINVMAMTILRYSALKYRLEQNALQYSLQGIFILMISKLILILTGLIKPNYFLFLIIMNISLFVLSLFYLFFQIMRFYDFNHHVINSAVATEIFKYAAPLMPLTLIAWFNESVSNLILRYNLGFGEVGIYTSGVAVASLITIVQTGFNTYWGTYVYENYKTDNTRIQLVNKYITFLLVTFAIFIMLFQDLIYLIIGPKYYASKLFFAFLIISPICLTIADTTGLGIDISKKSYLHLISTSLSAFTNLFLCILLLPIWGMTGAAISAAISGLVMLAARTIIGEKHYKCVQNYQLLIVSIIILSLASAISFIFNDELYKRTFILIPLTLMMFLLYKNEAFKLIRDFKTIFWNTGKRSC